MKANYNKLSFGHTINNLDERMPKGLSDCFAYGMVSGCDEHCPALLNGECKEHIEVIKSLNIPEEEKVELNNLYN